MRHLITQIDLIALRKRQADAFHKDGPLTLFEKVSAAIAEIADGEAVIGFGLNSKQILQFDKNGDVLFLKEETDVVGDDGESEVTAAKRLTQRFRGWNNSVRDVAVIGSIPCVAEVAGARYGAGLYVVAGRGDVGKTPFVHAFGALLGGNKGYYPIRFGEPMAGYNTDFDMFIEDVAAALVHDHVIVIDSLKDVMSVVEGTTATGGYSKGAFQLLSDIGAMAASRGSAVIVSVNPNSNDARLIDMMNEIARSNATALVVGDGANWDVFMRTGEGLPRLKHSLVSEYDELVMKFQSSTRAASHRTSINNVQSVVDYAEFEAVVRRLSKTAN